MNDQVILGGISGSLRKDSYNTRLLHAVQELLPENTRLELISIEDVPLYNGDLDLPIAQQRPEPAERFRDAIRKVQGLVICSPEYNHSIPGVMKNAIDWASRGDDSPIIGKPVALMGATPGGWGTVLMQQAFLVVFQTLQMPLVPKPEILVSKAKEKFDAEGKFTDEKMKEQIRKKLHLLREMILRNRV